MKTKKIVIDVTPSICDIRAIKRYCFHLSLELAKLETHLLLNFLYLGIKKRDYDKIPQFMKQNVSQSISSIPGKILLPFWKFFNSPKISWWSPPPIDLVHFPGGPPYIPTSCDKILSTFHGFYGILFPEFIDEKIREKLNSDIELILKNSTHFITVSETNKNEAVKLWNIPTEKIAAIPLGISPEFKVYTINNEEKEKFLAKYELPNKPFFLYIGAIEPHKNIDNIIMAFSHLPSSLKETYQLIFVGKKNSHLKNYQEKIFQQGIRDNVSFIDYIEPGSIDLAYLYNLAKIFIFPTFYEGWASPPLEAMKSGTPVVASDIPSLRESTGGVALYPNPGDPKDIAQKIQELIDDNNLYLKLQQKGLEFSGNFTWAKCAKETLAWYRKILEE